MSRPIVRWLAATFIALIFTLSLYNSSNWRSKLPHAGYYPGTSKSEPVAYPKPESGKSSGGSSSSSSDKSTGSGGSGGSDKSSGSTHNENLGEYDPNLSKGPIDFENPIPGIDADEKIPTGTSKSSGKGADKGKNKSQNGKSIWAQLPIHYPISSYKELPPKKPQAIPKIQHSFGKETAAERKVREERRATIVENFKHAWAGYRKHAWMQDEVKPLSGGGKDTFGGWAATLVDSLDTLWIMGLKEEFDEAVESVAKINFDESSLTTISTFETTIRYLGGLLSAYDLSGKEVLLSKARELGEMLYCAFDTENRLPISRFYLKGALDQEKQYLSSNVISAEVGSMSLEFTRLSQLTGDMKFFDAVQRVTDKFAEQQDGTKLPGLFPVMINAAEADFQQWGSYGLGALADSLYEYFPKEYMLLGGHHKEYQTLYEKAIDAAMAKLFFRPMTPDSADILMSGGASGDASSGYSLYPEGQHLVCFVGGMVAIGARIFNREPDVAVARKLTDGCIWAYEHTPTGIMPEVFKMLACPRADESALKPAASRADGSTPYWPACAWDEQQWRSSAGVARSSSGKLDAQSKPQVPEGFAAVSDSRYILRPEAIESVMILYRTTGDRALQEKGWKMWQAVEKYTRTPIAHAALDNVLDAAKPKQVDSMESFWTAETLKYYFLLFSEPDVISLDEYVFNTEAHPMKRPT